MDLDHLRPAIRGQEWDHLQSTSQAAAEAAHTLEILVGPVEVALAQKCLVVVGMADQVHGLVMRHAVRVTRHMEVEMRFAVRGVPYTEGETRWVVVRVLKLGVE